MLCGAGTNRQFGQHTADGERTCHNHEAEGGITKPALH